MLEKFQVAISPQPVVRSTSCFVLGWVFGDGGSNSAIFDSNKFKMAAAAILDNFEYPYLRNGSRSTYIARDRLSLLSTAFLFPSVFDSRSLYVCCLYQKTYFTFHSSVDSSLSSPVVMAAGYAHCHLLIAYHDDKLSSLHLRR